MLVKDALPQDGQYIVACNDRGGCWVEQFDVGENIGCMVAWFPISFSEFLGHNSAVATHRLFIKKSIEATNA